MKSYLALLVSFIALVGCTSNVPQADHPHHDDHVVAHDEHEIAHAHHHDFKATAESHEHKEAEKVVKHESDVVELTSTEKLALQPLFNKPSNDEAKSFPAASTTDKECVKLVGLAGKLTEDYEELVKHCGHEAGMKALSKTMKGKFTENHHSQTFTLNMVGGLCYRFFVATDSQAPGVSLRVERASGALRSLASSKQHVLLFGPKDVWCKNTDREYRIVVSSTASKETPFLFSVWAKPNPKGTKK